MSRLSRRSSESAVLGSRCVEGQRLARDDFTRRLIQEMLRVAPPPREERGREQRRTLPYLESFLDDEDDTMNEPLSALLGLGKLHSFCDYMLRTHQIRETHQLFALIGVHLEDAQLPTVRAAIVDLGIPSGGEPELVGSDWSALLIDFAEFAQHLALHGYRVDVS